VTPDFASSALSTETPLFTRDATGPQAFVALALLPDGYVYVVDDGGAIYRFRSARGVPDDAPASRVTRASRLFGASRPSRTGALSRGALRGPLLLSSSLAALIEVPVDAPCKPPTEAPKDGATGGPIAGPIESSIELPIELPSELPSK
jgi:hypothetical protein